MKTEKIIILAVLLLFALLSSVTSQRETFSQRRRKLLDEKKRQQQLTTTKTTTPPPQPDNRLAQAIRNVDDNGKIGFMDKLSACLNWGQFLTPIPKCLGVLATLLMAAGQTDDFSLNYENREPIGGYQYMKYSHSFRQTLLQISQSSYEAFLSAHSNMNKIRLSTKTIPDYLKMAVDILVSGNPKLIQQQIHPFLEVVKTSIEDNLAWSSEMVDRFDKLSNLTDEVRLQTLASSKDRTNHRTELLDQQETKKLTAESHKQLINNLDQNNKKDFSGYFRNVDDLVEAHKSTPTAIESFFMDAVQSFVNGYGSQQEKISDSTKPVSELPPDDDCIFKNNHHVFFLFARSQTILQEYSSLQSIDSASSGKYNATIHEDEFVKHLTKTSRKCKPFTSVLQLGNDTIQMMHQLANSKMPSDANERSSDSKQVHSSRQTKFGQVQKSMVKFNLEAGKLKDIALIPTKINTSKPTKTPTVKSKASENAKANALYKIAIHTEELKVLRESIDRNLKLTIRSTEESISILNEMRNWKAEQISMDRAIEILRICIIEMTDLKKTWSQLVIFFDRISNLIKLESGKSLGDFNKQIETTVNSTSFQQSAKLNKFVIKGIRELLKANQASTMLHNMASIYYSISNDYLMPRVQEMDTKMRFDSSFDMVKESSWLMHLLADDEYQIGQLITQDMRLLIEKVKQREGLIKREFAFLYEI